MVFIDNDEFGVDEYREDFEHVFDSNKIKVRLFRFNKDKTRISQNDFLGIKTPIYKDKPEYIEISISSDNPDTKKLDQEGYTDKGIREFMCYALYDTNINSKDTIKFIDNNYNLDSSQVLRIELMETGLIKGQYSYIHFKLIAE